MAQHAQRGYQPSSFKRSRMCPGWVRQSKGIPDKPMSLFAAEGVAAHKLGEMCIEQKKSPYDFVGWEGWVNNNSCFIVGAGLAMKPALFTFAIDDAMAEAVKVYVDYCLEIQHRAAYFQQEAKLRLDWLVPNIMGTIDHYAVIPGKMLYVTDLKFGAGQVVEVGNDINGNDQLAIYSLLAIGKENLHKVKEITATIVQPRAPHHQGSIRSVVYPVKDLYAWGNEVLVPAIRRMEAPDAPLCAGDWCRWCPALDTCPEVRKQMVDRVGAMFDDVPALVEKPDPTVWTGEKLDRFLELVDVFQEVVNAAKLTAFERLKNGSPDAPKRFKLVAGKLSDRKWVDNEQAVVDAFSFLVDHDQLFTEPKLKSPAQIEQVLKRYTGVSGGLIAETINSVIQERKAGNPSLVPIGDPRPALPPAVDAMFD